MLCNASVPAVTMRALGDGGMSTAGGAEHERAAAAAAHVLQYTVLRVGT